MANWYGFDIEDKRKEFFEQKRIVPLTDDILKLIYEYEYSKLYRQFDFVCLNDNNFYFYTGRYLLETDLDELIRKYHWMRSDEDGNEED